MRASFFIPIAAALLLGACGNSGHATAPSVAEYDADWLSASQPSEKVSAFRALSQRVEGLSEVGGEHRAPFCKAIRTDLFTTKFRTAQPEFETDDATQLAAHFSQCPSLVLAPAATKAAASDQVAKDRFEVYRIGGDYALVLFARTVIKNASAGGNIANLFQGNLVDLKQCRAAQLNTEALFAPTEIPRAMGEPVVLLRDGEYYFGGVASSDQTAGADSNGDYVFLWLATVFRPDGPPRPANAVSCEVTWCRGVADAPCKLPVSVGFSGTQEGSGRR